MKAEDTHEVEIVIALRIPKALPQRHIDRLSMALVTVAADMDHVIEAGMQVLQQGWLARLQFLHAEVGLMAGELMDCDTGGIFDRMTCMEAESIADVFAAGDQKAAADFIIRQHAVGDTEPGDMHHGKETHDDA